MRYNLILAPQLQGGKDAQWTRCCPVAVKPAPIRVSEALGGVSGMAPPLSRVPCPLVPLNPLSPVPPQHLNPKGVVLLVPLQPCHRSTGDPFSGP